MASKSLLRQLSCTLPSSSQRAFSTSLAVQMPPKVAVSVSRKLGNVNSALKKKSSAKVSRKTIAPEAIDLSAIPGVNPNPISLDHLPYLDPETLASEDAVGKLMRWPPDLIQDLKIWGMPIGQAKNSFPFTVPRLLTLDIADKLHHAKGQSSQNSKWILNGNSGSGKSYLLMQSMIHAMQSGWLTMYIPKSYRHVSSLYAYHYSEKTKTFHQPTLSSTLLSNFLKTRSNYALLDKIPLPKDFTFSPDVPGGFSGPSKRGLVDVEFKIHGGKDGKARTLKDLVELGVHDERISVAVLEAVLEVIANQSAVPFITIMDCAQTYFQTTEYTTPEGNKLEPYHLSTPRLFLDYISGRKHFNNGSFLLATAPTLYSYPINPDFLLGLGLSTTSAPANVIGAEGGPFVPRAYPTSPHVKLNKWHIENGKELQVMDVPEGMTLKEAAGLWQMPMEKRQMHITNSDEHFLMKYVENAGNPREFFKGVALSFL